ncbi:hypothetical protein AFUB_097460 [Aspergillus fumigatus A1163]|uniref:Uncharacterized protein n=1 Tax=Aspergillus fumigatus (strain CBS 144.89 / FGSC A1163 / CEA10) TaxID=451804 RepID=B0YE11_ASPFC|nr:hypothetical protein AFUB_097460 [Aspergillus fumigatus A1163]
MSFENVVPTEILFKGKLHASKYAAIFLVVVRGHKCVMKVVSLLDGAYQLTSLLKYLQHHGRGPRRYYEPEGRELDIHVLECSAYRRLKEHGLCDSGLVPNFLGSMRKFDPHLCQPHLNSFLYDEHLPSAIFLDYIPDLEMINIHNCTEKRLNNLITGVQEIHRALGPEAKEHDELRHMTKGKYLTMKGGYYARKKKLSSDLLNACHCYHWGLVLPLREM